MQKYRYLINFVNILGVRIDNFSKKEILEKIEFFLNEKHFHQIATVNPEFILQAQQKLLFKKVLNECNLNVADGIGIRYAFLRYGKWLKQRFSGVDLMHAILLMANKNSLEVFLAINKNGLSSYEETVEVLRKKYPNIAFSGKNIEPKSEAETIILDQQVLLCNFGAPEQEYFINKVKNDTIRLGMGVGGSFDFVTGKIKRAPKIMQFFGLEWLWRLIQQPRRWKRIFNATILFSFKIIFTKK